MDARRAQLAEAAAAAAAAKAREDAIAAAAKATSSDLAAVQSALAEIRDLTLRLTVSGVAAAVALQFHSRREAVSSYSVASYGPLFVTRDIARFYCFCSH